VFARDKSSLTIDAKTLHLFTQLMKQVVIANPQKCTIDAEYAKVHAQVWSLLQEWHAQVLLRVALNHYGCVGSVAGRQQDCRRRRSKRRGAKIRYNRRHVVGMIACMRASYALV
jgi:hypothetical protein